MALTDPISLTGLSSADSSWAGLINSVLNWRDGQRKVDFLNLSVGYSGIIDSYSEQDLRANFGTAIAAMAQAGASDKTILIWSAGNAHGDPCDPADVAQCENGKVNAVSVEVLPGLVARIPELRGIPSPWWRCGRRDTTNNIPSFLQSLRYRRRLLPRGPRGTDDARLFTAPTRAPTDSGGLRWAEGHPMPRPWSRAGWR